MSDEFDVIVVCTRMAWYADQQNWEALTGLFGDTVLLDYTSLNGGEPAVLTPEQIASAWAGSLGGFDATQHLVTNHLVTVDGDKAVCTAAFQATHYLPNPHGSPLWTLGGDYRFDLVRTAGKWRIAGLMMTARWADGNQHLMTMAAER